MSRLPYGKQKVMDELQRKLDDIEKTWPMTGSYERITPYVIPMMQGNHWFEFICYHMESMLWFDKSYFDLIVHMIGESKSIRPGSTAFDLGCNSGALTLPMAAMAGDEGSIHAFDPYPWNAAATDANAKMNNLHNVTAHAVGLSNKSQLLAVSPNDSRTYAELKSENAQHIVIKKYSEFAKLNPEFIKIDIEGAEYDLFDVSAKNSPFKSLKSAALEFHPMWLEPRGVDCKEALRNIERHGFSLHFYSPESPAYDVDAFDSHQHMFWLKRK